MTITTIEKVEKTYIKPKKIIIITTVLKKIINVAWSWVEKLLTREAAKLKKQTNKASKTRPQARYYVAGYLTRGDLKHVNCTEKKASFQNKAKRPSNHQRDATKNDDFRPLNTQRLSYLKVRIHIETLNKGRHK